MAVTLRFSRHRPTTEILPIRILLIGAAGAWLPPFLLLPPLSVFAAAVRPGGGGPTGKVNLLERDDDQKRSNLRNMGQVAGNKNDGAIFADRARERHRGPGQHGRCQ